MECTTDRHCSSTAVTSASSTFYSPTHSDIFFCFTMRDSHASDTSLQESANGSTTFRTALAVCTIPLWLEGLLSRLQAVTTTCRPSCRRLCHYVEPLHVTSVSVGSSQWDCNMGQCARPVLAHSAVEIARAGSATSRISATTARTRAMPAVIANTRTETVAHRRPMVHR